MPNYELTYIARPTEEANLAALNERINSIVTNAGGEIAGRNDWGRRRLAYPIQKNPDGYYTTLFVTMPGAAVRGVERSLQLNDDVLRYLVVRVETFKIPAAPAPATLPPAQAQPTAETPAQPEAGSASAPESEAAPAPAQVTPEPTAEAAPNAADAAAPAAEGS